MRTKRQKLTLKEKKAANRSKRMNSAKGNSEYARKKEYLHTHGGSGFDYPDKPWK